LVASRGDFDSSRRVERSDGRRGDRGKQQRGVVITRDENQAVGAVARERPQCREFRRVCRDHAREPTARLLLRATEPRVARPAIIDRRLQELERIAVEHQVSCASARFVNRAEE